MSDEIRDAEGKRPRWMELEAQAPHGCVDTKPGYGEEPVVAENATAETANGNGNYLGQSFEGVQPCPKCCGKGFMNPDGTAVNAFSGSDYGPTIPCPDCQAIRLPDTRTVAKTATVDARIRELESRLAQEEEEQKRLAGELAEARRIVRWYLASHQGGSDPKRMDCFCSKCIDARMVLDAAEGGPDA
jgi:hypothetical protein